MFLWTQSNQYWSLPYLVGIERTANRHRINIASKTDEAGLREL